MEKENLIVRRKDVWILAPYIWCIMKNFYVITNSIKDKNEEVTNCICKLLEENGAMVCKNSNVDIKTKDFGFLNPADINKDVECVIVVGGDGTLIQVARDLKYYNVPLIGVNLGNLGYLAEIELEYLEESIKMLINDEYTIEERIMLHGDIYSENKLVTEEIALNDMVLGRSDVLRILDYKIYIDGRFLGEYRGDGVIVSTPTGSTAYNLSAGGPVLEPNAKIIAITPICAHGKGASSLVVSADSKITIELCDKGAGRRHHNTLFVDGSHPYNVWPENIVEITKSKLTTRIVKLNRLSFVEVLHKKMN